MHRRGGLIPPPPLDQSRQRVDGPVINVQVNAGNLSSAVTVWHSSLLAARSRGISPRLIVVYRAILVRGIGKRIDWKLWGPFRARTCVPRRGRGRGPNVEYRRESINPSANNQQLVPEAGTLLSVLLVRKIHFNLFTLTTHERGILILQVRTFVIPSARCSQTNERNDRGLSLRYDVAPPRSFTSLSPSLFLWRYRDINVIIQCLRNI